MNLHGPPCFVVDLSDPLNNGQCFKELFAVVHPLQQAVHCKPLSKAERANVIKISFANVLFSPKQVLGKNTIGQLLQELCKAAGIRDWKKKTPHTLRQYMATVLANDPNVSRAETQHLMRHGNTALQDACICRNAQSHVAAMNAPSCSCDVTNHVSAVVASPISNMPLFNSSSFATVNGSNLDASVAAHQYWNVPQVASPFGLIHPMVGAPLPLPFNGMTNGSFGSNYGMIMPNYSTPVFNYRLAQHMVPQICSTTVTIQALLDFHDFVFGARIGLDIFWWKIQEDRLW